MQWFLTGGTRPSPQGGVNKLINFRGASPYTLYNMKGFCTGKCSVQFPYLKSGGRTTGQLLKGGVVERRLRTVERIYHFVQ